MTFYLMCTSALLTCLYMIGRLKFSQTLILTLRHSFLLSMGTYPSKEKFALTHSIQCHGSVWKVRRGRCITCGRRTRTHAQSWTLHFSMCMVITSLPTHRSDGGWRGDALLMINYCTINEVREFSFFLVTKSVI